MVEWYYLGENEQSPRMLSAPLHRFQAEPVAVRDRCFEVLSEADIWRLCVDASAQNLTYALAPISNIFRSEPLTRPQFRARAPSDRVVLVETQQNNRREAVAFNLDTAHSETVADLDTNENLLAFTSNGNLAYVRRSDRNGITIWQAAATKPRTAMTVLNAHFGRRALPHADIISYEFGGKTLGACVYRMSDGAESAKVPIIAWVYPETVSKELCGSGDGSSGLGYLLQEGYVDTFTPQYFASMGYTVVVPATPATLLNTASEAGANFSLLTKAAIDAVGERGWGDIHRVCLYGASQGGFSALKVLTQTDRFRCAVAGFSQSNYTSDFADFGAVNGIIPGLYLFGKSQWYPRNGLRAPGYPWRDPSWFVRSSPYFEVEKIKTPLLLLGSDLDGFAPINEFNQMFTALFLERQDVEFVRYWGEGHFVESPANVRDVDQRMRSWFETYLRGTGPESGPVELEQ